SDVLGYYKDTKIQQGETGSTITLAAQTYTSQTNSGGFTVYPVASQTRYRNTDGTGGEITNYTYTFYTGKVQPREVDVARPIVAPSQNGPGGPQYETDAFGNDNYGRPEWRKDANGRIFYPAHDNASGGVTKQIADVNTANTGDFADLPSGWSSGSNPLHLITQF